MQHPDRGDPGAVEIGYYSVDGRDLTMTEETVSASIRTLRSPCQLPICERFIAPRQIVPIKIHARSFVRISAAQPVTIH